MSLTRWDADLGPLISSICSTADLSQLQADANRIKAITDESYEVLQEFNLVLMRFDKNLMYQDLVAKNDGVFAYVMDLSETKAGKVLNSYLKAMAAKVKDIDSISKVIKDKETSVEDSVALFNKAQEYYELIMIVKDTIELLSSASSIKPEQMSEFAREILESVSSVSEQDPVSVNEPSIKDIIKAKDIATQKYEELKLTITKSTTRTPREPRFDITIAAREGELIEKLKDPTSDVFRRVYQELQNSGRNDCDTDRKIKNRITKFIEKAESLHAERKLIKSNVSLESDSVAALIYKAGGLSLERTADIS